MARVLAPEITDAVPFYLHPTNKSVSPGKPASAAELADRAFRDSAFIDRLCPAARSDSVTGEDTSQPPVTSWKQGTRTRLETTLKQGPYRRLGLEKLEDRMALSGAAATYAEELRLQAPYSETGAMVTGTDIEILTPETPASPFDKLLEGKHTEGAPLLNLDTKEWIYASDLSADGGMLVTGGRPSTLYAYRTEDLAKGELKPVLALKNTGNPYVQSVAVSPDGKTIVSGGNGKKIVAVEIASGQVLWTKDVAGNVNKITFLDSETVLAQVDYGAIQRVNVRTGAMSTAFPEAGDAVWLFDSDQKGEKTVVGGEKAGLYDETGKKIRDFPGIPAGLGDVAISPDGSKVGLGGTDGTLVILDSETGKEIARGNAGGWVGKIQFLSEDTIATFAAPKWLVMLKIEGNRLVVDKVLATGGDIGSIAFDPNRPEVLVVTNGTKLEVHKTGLKRPAPVVTAKAPSTVPVEKPAAAAPEVTTVAAPVNAKAVDAAIVALEKETAFQAEKVLSRRTLEGLDGNEELKKRGKAWLTTGPDPDTGRKTEIRITSPYDQSFLVTPLGVIKLDHPGGVQNKVGFGRILSDGAIVNFALAAHPRLEFVLYADEGRTVMLDRLVFEGDRANGSFALLTEQRTEAREWETEPGMQVLLTERANVTLAVESPMAGAVLELTGGGFLGKKVLKEGFSTPTLTMDGTKPSGTYEVQLLDRPNGAILARAKLNWDHEGKKLTASEPLQAFVPKAHVSARGAMRSTDPLDSTRGFQAVFGALSEEVAQVMAVDQAIETQQKMAQAGGAAVIASRTLDGAQADVIVNTQRGNLMALAGQADERFQFSLDPDKLWVKFLEVLQGWREENKAQTMERMRIPEREFYYIRGAEFDYYRKYLDGFNEAVGRMLEAGMNAILTARAGGDAAPHLKQLDALPAEYGVVMDRFSLLRIKLPDRWVILEAAEAILERKAGELITQQRAAEARVQGEEKKFNNPGNAFAGNGPGSNPLQVIGAARQSFIDQLKAKYAVEPMYGLDGKTIIGYGGVLGTTVAKAGTLDAGTVGGVSVQEAAELQLGPNTDLGSLVNVRYPSMEMTEEEEAIDTSKPLVVIFLGSTQKKNIVDESWVESALQNKDLPTGPNPNTPGLNALALKLRKEGYQVVVFESGDNISSYISQPGEVHVNYDPMFAYAKKWILSKYSNAQHAAGILYVGYSWGGGEVFEMTTMHEQELKNVPLLGAAYVDAIIPRNLNGGQEQLAGPIGAPFVFNVYETNSPVPHGAPILFKDPHVQYFEQHYPTDTHGTIDNNKVVLDDLEAFVRLGLNTAK